MEAALDAVHEAIERGAPPAELARLARAAGPDALNAPHGPLGATALQRSALCGRGGEALRALLGEGADPRAEGEGGWTALHAAAACEGPEAIAVLIEAGADLRCRNHEMDTPLHLAAKRRRGAAEAFMALLEGAGDDEERSELLDEDDYEFVTPLQEAALKGNSRVLEAVHRAGYPVPDGQWEALLTRCTTPACVAAAAAALREASPDDADHVLNVALRSVVRRPCVPNPAVARALLRAGASPWARDPVAGRSAADFAHKSRSSAMVLQCPEYAGIPLEEFDGLGPTWTPLHAAAYRRDADEVAALLAGGADADAATERSGETPLLIATERGGEACVRALLAGGASPGGFSGAVCMSPLREAMERGNVACVRALLEGGASPTKTPIFYEVGSRPDDTVPPDEEDDRLLRVVELLLAHGASLAPSTHYHYSPLRALCFKNAPALVDYLLRAGGGRHANSSLKDSVSPNYFHYLAPLCQWTRGRHPAQLEHEAAREALERSLPRDVANIALAYVMVE